MYINYYIFKCLLFDYLIIFKIHESNSRMIDVAMCPPCKLTYLYP
jgi:hypothetical protein